MATRRVVMDPSRKSRALISKGRAAVQGYNSDAWAEHVTGSVR